MPDYVANDPLELGVQRHRRRTAMGQYVGLDVSLEETKVHVLDNQGKRVWHGACVSHPAAI